MRKFSRAIGSDRLAIRPAILPIAICLFVGLAYSFSPMFNVLLLLLGLSVSLGWLLVTVILLIVAARNRLWRRSASLLAILIFIWPVMVGLKTAAELVSDYIHLALAYPYYASEIAISKRATMPIGFNWGGTGFAGSGNLDRSLVYDPIDEGTNHGKITPNQTVTVHHLIGHFYVVESRW